MKTLITLITFAFISTAATAGCIFGETSGDFGSGLKRFDHLVEKSLEKGVHFTRHEVNIIKIFTKDMLEEEFESFQDIRDHYENDSYDELHTLRFIDLQTSIQYTYVWGYPGDNEAGVIFNRKGQLVAEVGDGDIYNCKLTE